MYPKYCIVLLQKKLNKLQKKQQQQLASSCEFSSCFFTCCLDMVPYFVRALFLRESLFPSLLNLLPRPEPSFLIQAFIEQRMAISVLYV